MIFFRALSVAWVAFCMTIGIGLPACQDQNSTKALSTEDLVSNLQSKEGEQAHLAAAELFVRGEAAIPFLVRLKGNKNQFTGAAWLGNPVGSQLIFPGGINGDPSTSVPLEVAALFLINAIYENNFKFAQSPYLTDLALPPIQRRASNSHELIDRAWKSVEPWVVQMDSLGIDQMRKQKQSPLDGSRVAFW